MRVSAQAKIQTRQRILEAARQLFAQRGFGPATTRDIADAAGIATGTLFNYFTTKEAVLARLVADAAEHVSSDAIAGESVETFEEDLFAFIAAGLRALRPLRKHLPALQQTVLTPLADGAVDDACQFPRTSHLATVAALAKKHGLGEPSPVALQLYWTLYIGVLLFWATDRSPRQEDTLALLDDSVEMFAGWLRREANNER